MPLTAPPPPGGGNRLVALLCRPGEKKGGVGVMEAAECRRGSTWDFISAVKILKIRALRVRGRVLVN